jgi:trehalose-phosphatase
MTHALLQNLVPIGKRLAAASHVLIGLDYDGTLTPIVNDPAQATLGSDVRELLCAIAARPRTSVAVVSGRGLLDVRTQVGIDEIIYAGNHGLEIAGPSVHFTEPTAVKNKKALEWITRALANELAAIAGVVVEDKGLTVTVHYRQVVASLRKKVFRHVTAALAVAPKTFRGSPGHEVIEIRPCVDWHKGTALKWIADHLKTPKVLTVFVGDDQTDEDAFRFLQGGITVKVGDFSGTSANFHVEGPADVASFLRWLANLDKEGVRR